MVVEDDEGIRLALEQALEEEGYVVLSAGHGQEALDILAEAERLPDVILLDLMMPIMDGRTFLQARRRQPRWTSIPVVIVTADNRAEPEAKALGAAAVMAKPLSLDRLLETVARFC